MSKHRKVMVAGHICLDITPVFNPDHKGNFGEIFAPGKLINVQEAAINTGGVVSNTGLAMAKLGMDVELNGKIGEDEFGSAIKHIIGADKVSSVKTISGQSSSYSIVLALPGVDRIFLHHPGANDTFDSEDIEYDTLTKCSLLHFGYPTLMKKMYADEGLELYKIFKKAKEIGVITSLDLTLPDPKSPSGQADWPKILKRVLPLVDLFLPSIEEIAYMLDRDLFETRKAQTRRQDPVLRYTSDDCSMLAGRLLDWGVKIAVIKMGIKGIYLKTAGHDVLKPLASLSAALDLWANRELWAPSYKTETFGSATGAGDVTIAGFLTAFLKGLDPVQTVKTANLLGWQNVQKVGTVSGVQDWQTTAEMIQDDKKPRNPLVIDTPGWRFCDSDLVYHGPGDPHYK